MLVEVDVVAVDEVVDVVAKYKEKIYSGKFAEQRTGGR